MPERMISLAEQFLLAARHAFAAEAFDASYANARTAAELYGKAALLGKEGNFPRKHAIAHDLFVRGLVPTELSARELSRFLSDHTRGEYEIEAPVTRDEAARAIEIALLLGEPR